MRRRRVDAHAHVWARREPWLDWLDERPESWHAVRQVFPWARLRAELDAAGIDDVVLVQAGTCTEETELLLRLAEEQPSVAGVVGWVGLGSVAATEKDLAATAEAGTKLVGVRAMHRWRPDGEVLADPRVTDSFRVLAERDLAVDLFVNDHTELPLLPPLVERAPGRYVLDHLGRPPVGGDVTAWRLWAEAMARLAALPEVYVKFSGWATVVGRTTAEDVAPFLAHVLDTFGPQRTMYAGNWPVALCAADDYAQVWAASSEALAPLGPADLDAVLGGTARDCYRCGT